VGLPLKSITPIAPLKLVTQTLSSATPVPQPCFVQLDVLKRAGLVVSEHLKGEFR
jgi:hypothetical protein